MYTNSIFYSIWDTYAVDFKDGHDTDFSKNTTILFKSLNRELAEDRFKYSRSNLSSILWTTERGVCGISHCLFRESEFYSYFRIRWPSSLLSSRLNSVIFQEWFSFWKMILSVFHSRCLASLTLSARVIKLMCAARGLGRLYYRVEDLLRR